MIAVRLFGLLAIAATAIIVGRANAQSPAERETVLATSDCVMVEPDSNSPPTLKHCGFRRVELNRAGNRLLTMSLSGTAQLWDRSGRELLTVQTKPYSGILGGAMIAGGDLYIFEPAGMLLRFDIVEGREVSRLKAPIETAYFMQVYGEHYVLAIFRDGAADKFGLIDLRTGVWVRRWDNLRPSWDGAGKIIGTYDVKIAPEKWQTRIAFADAALSEVAVSFSCELELAEQACIGRDQNGHWVSMLNIQSNKITRYNVPSLSDAYLGLEWIGTIDRPFAVTCKLTPSKQGSPENHCAVIDAVSSNAIYRFASGHNYKISAGQAPNGESEIRVAIAEGWSSDFQVMRVDLSGTAVPVGPRTEDVGLTSLHGHLLLGMPGEPGIAAIAGNDGLTDERVPLRFAHCVPSNGCSASADKSIVAITESGPMRDPADAAMDRVRWFETGWRPVPKKQEGVD